MFESTQIYVTDMNVTPFTIGLLRPKIVLPKVIVDRYGRDELNIIIRHEQTHIQLGHLWCGFAWDILRCLLWINPFLTIFLKSFQEDMEDICDRVCIQNSGKEAREYGLVLLKSLRLLRSKIENVPSAPAYFGEKNFVSMKRRMGQIVNFRPYRKRLCRGITAGAALCIVAALMIIYTHSYARCNENNDIMVDKYGEENEIISSDTGKLSKMISYDDHYVYVKRNSEDVVVQIPYESIRDDWYYKMLEVL